MIQFPFLGRCDGCHRLCDRISYPLRSWRVADHVELLCCKCQTIYGTRQIGTVYGLPVMFAGDARPVFSEPLSPLLTNAEPLSPMHQEALARAVAYAAGSVGNSQRPLSPMHQEALEKASDHVISQLVHRGERHAAINIGDKS